MINIFLFGGSNPTSKLIKKNFHKYIKNVNLLSFSRKDKNDYNFDLNNSIYPEEMEKNGDNIYISLTPIWLFVPFLENYLRRKKRNKIKALIVISSTSALTKKYSWNKFDKNLSKKLSYWEDKLIEISKIYKLSLTIIRPTLIYGNFDKDEDKNISILRKILRRSPFLFIPKVTGLRQPIHTSQLALCILKITKSNIKNLNKKTCLKTLNIGGDEVLTYENLLKKIKTHLPINDSARNCLIIKIPNRFFFLLCAPILGISPRTYASIERLAIDMSGFEPSYKITGMKKKKFPIYQNE